MPMWFYSDASRSIQATFLLQDGTSDGTNNTSYTFSENWGVAGKLILCLRYLGSGATPDVTIAGNTATQIGTVVFSSNRGVIFYYVDTPSTSGNVVISFPSGSASICCIVMYSISSGFSAASSAAGTGGGTSNSASVSIPNNGCLIAYVTPERLTSGAISNTWTNATKDTTDIAVGSSGIPNFVTQSAAHVNATLAQSITVTDTFNATVGSFSNFLVLTP